MIYIVRKCWNNKILFLHYIWCKMSLLLNTDIKVGTIDEALAPLGPLSQYTLPRTKNFAFLFSLLKEIKCFIENKFLNNYYLVCRKKSVQNKFLINYKKGSTKQIHIFYVLLNTKIWNFTYNIHKAKAIKSN